MTDQTAPQTDAQTDASYYVGAPEPTTQSATQPRESSAAQPHEQPRMRVDVDSAHDTRSDKEAGHYMELGRRMETVMCSDLVLGVEFLSRDDDPEQLADVPADVLREMQSPDAVGLAVRLHRDDALTPRAVAAMLHHVADRLAADLPS